MEKVMIFSETNDPFSVQVEINEWLAENQVTIVRVLQTQSGRMDTTLTITIFYVENDD